MHKVKNLTVAAKTSTGFFIDCIQEVFKDIDPETKFNVRPYNMNHLIQLDLRHEQQEHLKVDIIGFYNYIANNSSFNVSLFYEDKIILLGGVNKMWTNVGDGWLFVDKDFPKYFSKHPRLVLHGFRTWFNSLPYTRIQTPVLTTFTMAQRFLEVLGFKREGYMEKFGEDGADYYMYSFIKGRGK